MGAATPARGGGFVFIGTPMEGYQLTGAILMGAIFNSLAVARAYYGLKADNVSLGAEVKQAILQERLDRQGENNTLHSLCSKLESNLTELSRRIETLETGQDQWTQALRKRTHDIADLVQTLVLKVDRLERPGKYEPPK